MKCQILLLSGTAWLLSACGVASSGNILTAEIHPFLEVAGNSLDTVTCRAFFRQGSDSGPDITLTEGDAVSCTDGTVTVQMKEDSTLFTATVEYSGTGLGYDPAKTYSVIVSRPKSGETFTSTATLPPAMSVSSPLPGFQIVKGNPILMTWVGAASNGVAATVTHELTPNGATSTFGANATETSSAPGQLAIQDYSITRTGLVPATIRLKRDRNGSQDSKWGGRGRIVGSQFSDVAGWFSSTAPLQQNELSAE